MFPENETTAAAPLVPSYYRAHWIDSVQFLCEFVA